MSDGDLLPMAPQQPFTQVQQGAADDLTAIADITVLSEGNLNKSPICSGKAETLEISANVPLGTYFIEVARDRIFTLLELQMKWFKKRCNSKYSTYINVQRKILMFQEKMLKEFEQEFGPISDLPVLPYRQRQKKTRAVIDK